MKLLGLRTLICPSSDLEADKAWWSEVLDIPIRLAILLDMSSSNQTPVEQIASKKLQYFINLSQMQAVVSRRFDHMGSMVGFTDFMVLYHLSQADEQKMRRIDLAEKMGMTASGVTRVLLPMEKLRLVERESNPRDGRVSMAKLTAGGQRVLTESMERAEIIADDLIAPADVENIPVMMRINEDIRRAAL